MKNKKGNIGITLIFLMLLLISYIVISLTSPAFTEVVNTAVDVSGMEGLEAMFFNNWSLILILGATLGFFVFINR